MNMRSQWRLNYPWLLRSPVVSDAVMGSDVESPCIVIKVRVYCVAGSRPCTSDLVLDPSSVTLEVSVPSAER